MSQVNETGAHFLGSIDASEFDLPEPEFSPDNFQDYEEPTPSMPRAEITPAKQVPQAIDNRGDVARLLDLGRKRYQIDKFLAPTINMGPNFPTALALIQAIDNKGTKKGWDYIDLQLALPATLAALKTAGLAHSQEGFEALLSGATGDFKGIMKTILPEVTPWYIKGITAVMIGGHQTHKILQAGGLLWDEAKIENRLLGLTRLQRDILLDPARTRAVLELLNFKPSSLYKPKTQLPRDAEEPLTRISFFSLQDMIGTTKLFNAIDRHGKSNLLIQRNKLWFETEGERLLAAAKQLGMITGDASAAVAKTLLLVTGMTIGGLAGGLILAGKTGVEIFTNIVTKNGAEPMNIKWPSFRRKTPATPYSPLRPASSLGQSAPEPYTPTPSRGPHFISSSNED